MNMTLPGSGDDYDGVFASKKNTIHPDKNFANDNIRFKVSHYTLGKLERLAKARFRIRQLTNEDLTDWQNISNNTFQVLAQSVNASSEIEGESISAEEQSILNAPVTEPFDGVSMNSELATRREAIRSIYNAYLWMLSNDSEIPIISYEMIVECHKKMFETTKADKAGVIKKKKVVISGGDYHIETLLPELSEEYLRKICSEFNSKWDDAKKYSEYSRFILIAEFILDFLAIHPFSDGNGRLARLLSTYLLEKAGYHFARFYPIDAIILEFRAEYYEALYEGQLNWYKEGGDITKWIEFYSTVVFKQWKRAYERVKDEHLRKKHKS